MCLLKSAAGFWKFKARAGKMLSDTPAKGWADPYSAKDVPQPQVDAAFGFSIEK